MRGSLVVAGLLLAALLGACGEKKKDRAAATSAARVNGSEVSLAQINQVLQSRSLRPDQSDAASRQVLERLIEQAVVVQQAESIGLDRDARVALQLEAARREVLARAYADKVGEAVKPPSADEIRAFYAERPALFRDRRLYQLHEIGIEAGPDQVAALRQRLTASSPSEFVEWLKSSELRFVAGPALRPTEQLSAGMLENLQRIQPGQAVVVQTPSGLQVTVLVGSVGQPVGEEQARPLIERHLLNEARRKAIDDEVRALRAKARIEYLGQWGPPAASAEPAASGASTPLR